MPDVAAFVAAPPLRLDTRPIPTRLPMGLSEPELERGYSRCSVVALAAVSAGAILRVFEVWPQGAL